MSSVIMAPAGMMLGVRVVRGPDWKWGNQDGGEGHVGTVIEIGRPGSKTSPDKTVVVQWDSGNKTNYRAGYQGAHDLLILDNAPAGVRHSNVVCDGCGQQGITGIRWSCTKCKDFDLCSPCYSTVKHDITHVFNRQNTANSKPCEGGKRQDSVLTEMMGVFPGAKVERGPAWEWGNQDGGDGKTGKVLDIRGWDTETDRSVANIIWSCGTANVYRLGHKGKVDLKYRIPAEGGYYFKEHLPVLGELVEQINAPPPCPFRVGNKVKVEMDPEVLKVMQEGHGGWNPKMAEYVKKIGTVHRITDKGDIRVQYEGCSNRWTFHPGALTKILVYNVGDVVMVIRDIERVKKLQKGHGEWTECMATVLGHIGKVVKVYSDGDMRVAINSQTWTFNPLCCKPRPEVQTQLDNTRSTGDNPGVTKSSLAPGVTANSLKGQLVSEDEGFISSDSLVKEAAQGHIDIVKSIVSKHPDQINKLSGGKTALQVACHQGGIDMVKALLKRNANVELKDSDGDTPLHYSAFGNQPAIMKLLLDQGALVNATNDGGCSSLHVAVNKQHLECVKILMKYGCDVNVQDTYGDTAQHDAIGKDNAEIVTMLTDHRLVDFSLKNKRGFNTLQHAALKGNAFATEKILSRASMIVDLKKDDGFSALHLACLNGHCAVAEVLVKQGRADVEIKNNRRQTALMLACSQGHMSVVRLLVEAGADVLAKDEDGHSPLHLVFLRLQADNIASSTPKGDQTSFAALVEEATKQSTMIATFLAKNGADVTQINSKGQTPLDLIPDRKLRAEMEKYRIMPEPTECMVCDEQEASVTFEPCRHKVACPGCCIKMKKCLKCMAVIERKVMDGSELDCSELNIAPGSEDVKEMKTKLQEMEDTLMCVICLDRKKNVAFMCGHSACSECAQPLRQCHMCRKPITKRINLFT